MASANDVEHQPDLIIAKHESVTHGSTEAPNSVSLNFSHVLTAITFAVGSDMVPGTVKSIAIKGVKNTGDYDLSTGQWKTSGADANFTINLGGGNGIAFTGQKDLALTSGDQTLMMIPQTFDMSSNAKVEIVFTPTNGQDKTLSASLANTSWTEGSTIIYKVSTSSLLPTLTLNNITFPTDWSNHAEYGGKLKSDYQDNDQLGLYVIAADGRVKAANVPVTRQGGKWTFPATQPHIKVGDKVFAYYPYQQNVQGMPAQNETVTSATLTDANAFFKSLEAAWSPNADQSTIDNMNASDLQVSTVSSVNNTGSGIDLTMSHAMGLADLTLGKGPTHFKLSEGEDYRFDGTHFACDDIEGRKLYKLAKNHYVAIVSPNKQTEFKPKNAVCLPWKQSSLIFQPTIAGIQKKTADPIDNDQTIYLYTLKPGDVYYSDGACSHQDDDLEAGKTPIGIVGYVGQNKWTEYQTGSGHGGHALVMCLLNDGANRTNLNGPWTYCGPAGDYGTVKQSTPAIVLKSKNEDYGSGLLNTELFIKAGNNHALRLKSYRTNGQFKAPLNKSTDWFLPTAGQSYALYSQIAGGVNVKNWTVVYDIWEDSKKVTDQIDKYLSKVGEGNYTPLWGDGIVLAYATSSELNVNQCLILMSDCQNNHGDKIKIGRAGLATTGDLRGQGGVKGGWDTFTIRPFLAF